MNTKLLTFNDFKDIPSQFLCKICYQIYSQMRIIDKQSYCFDCLCIYKKINHDATSFNNYFYYHSTCICHFCNRNISVYKFQKHFKKCSESW